MSTSFRLMGPVVPERVIQDAVLKYLPLDRRVAWAKRFNTGAHVVDGASEQRDFLASVNAAGGIGFVARCVEDVQQGLNAAAIEIPATSAPRLGFAQ